LPELTKIDILKCCEEISHKYPEKTREVIDFMVKCVRDRGEVGFKSKAIKKLAKLMKKKKAYTDLVLDFLCEYMEDPFSPKLVLLILNILNVEVTSASEPRKYLRFILNRVHLDDDKIRSTAITCLGEIGNKCPAVLPECVSIIKAYLHDIDSEVRDRANFYWSLLAGSEIHKVAYNDEIFDMRFIESAQELIKAGLESDSPMDYQKVFAEGQSKASQSLSPIRSGPTVANLDVSAERPQNSRAEKQVSQSVSKEALQFFKQHEDFSEYGDLKLVSKTIVAAV
jgi:hypothetical protein